jgi:glucose-6-phosphate isomerase
MQTISQLMANDPNREKTMQIEAAGLRLNFANHPVNEAMLEGLCNFAKQQALDKHIEALQQGGIVNLSENRAAWHMALRDPQSPANEVHAALEKINAICETVQNSEITDVVHLGLGGSFWGPKLAMEALADLPSKQQVHFVAELDETELNDALTKLQAETTLFIIVSKSFTSTETLHNAERAKQWLQQTLDKEQAADRLLAITANSEKAENWGVPAQNILPMWDWVGGRFSVWSAVGLPIALAYGTQSFRAFLNGAHTMDQHFTKAPYRENMPVIMALLNYSYTQQQIPSQAILPYAYRLRSLVPYLQQLYMESLGKHCNKQGQINNTASGPILWGTTGTHAQHTFSQFIHQSGKRIPVDFILINDGSANAQALRAQCLAQSQTLSFGDPDNPEAHQRIPGNQPHNIIELNYLTPATTGALLALYEHTVATLAHLLNINAFDQFGVEHSKRLLTTMRENNL